MKFHVPEMSCGHCTAAITKEIANLDPGAEVSTDLESHMVELTTSQPETAVIHAIKIAGYDAEPA